MDVRILPGGLKGSVAAPPSKSMAHRAILAAALAKGRSVIRNVSLSDDVMATLRAAETLGARVDFSDGVLTMDGLQTPRRAEIDCGESGTTLRLLIPVLAALKGGVLTGRGRLPDRPLDAYVTLFDEKRVVYERHPDGLPLTVEGGLPAGRYALSGAVSSQFVSGLMFALPLVAGQSEIVVADNLESAGYVDMTLQALRYFGIRIGTETPHERYRIRGMQTFLPCAFEVEGDWSQAAFFFLAGAAGGDVTVKGLNPETCQRDKGFLTLLRDMGADIAESKAGIRVRKSDLRAVRADVSQMIDCAPALAGAMAVARGESVIVGGRRLREKESDRIAATAAALRAIGADVDEREDGFVIRGKSRLKGGVACSGNDHRIAMTLAALSPACENGVVIRDAQAVGKSYTDFFADFAKLGGMVT